MINFYDINTYFIFILGLLIGSFLNVVIYRMPRELTISKGRSMCTSCGNQLKWFELFPLFSYLFLRGKCRHCKEKISVQYPLVEATTGVVFTLIYSYIMQNNGFLELHHILLFIIAALAIVGIFTDFLYHGTFDFSTIWVCGLYFIYLILATKSITIPFTLLLQSLVYFAPIFFIVLYVHLKSKGKWILAILSLVCIIFGSMFALVNFPFDIYTSSLIGNSIINWISLSALLIIADYIIKKFIKSHVIKNSISHILNSINFILYFLFIFNLSENMFNTTAFKHAFEFNTKNSIILGLFVLFYMFFIEIFNGHDNDEELIDNNEEIIDRDENIFSSYIGDGDLFILPFIGMLLGYGNVFNFYAILGFSVLSIYTLVFRKGFKYTIPLYPFIMLSIFVLL